MTDYDAKAWWQLLLQTRGSVLPKLRNRILIAGGIGVVAAVLYRMFEWYVPSLVHQLVGVALGLLLVFRTNSSYDRYWEGRKMLGMLVNRSRDLARQVVTFVEGDDEATRAGQAEIVRHLQLQYALTRMQLRRERDLGALGGRLTPAERAILEPAACRPNVCAMWITARLAAFASAGQLTEQRLAAMDANLTAMADALGGAERILKTPIPFAYAQHIKSFLVLFCFSAPFALVETMRWSTPFASAVLAYALFGIDEIGVEIEEPFGYDPNDLPLDRIGETIDADTVAILVSVSARRLAAVSDP
jgi:putative membrane protein